MRLLKAGSDGSFIATWFASDQIPPYAILSHRWEADNQEVTLQDLTSGVAGNKEGFRKLWFCCEQAKKDGLEYFWVDSCCIDKINFTELSTAINSMFRWYRDSVKCYVYLSDVSTGKHSRSSEVLWDSAFRHSKWFTRGWTLQELLAPRSVEFFSRDGQLLGDRNSLVQQIHEITGIAVQALQGADLAQFSVQERMIWSARRQTTVEEDQAYCLMGIFSVFLPVIYGEGKENARKRLREEIDKLSEEHQCLQALRTSDYEQFKDRNPHRLEGTCQWFLQHDRFQEWQQSNLGLLWVSADPGCGKSVLARSLIDIEVKSGESRSICYFFFKDDNDKQRSSTSALSALLHQLFSQTRSLINHAIDDYRVEGHQLSESFHKLWTILTKAASDPKAGEIVCVLDALDECAERERYLLIDTLSAFYKQRNSCKLKFLITSRPYFDIERRFAHLIRDIPTIRLHGEKESKAISYEINLVIKSKVADMALELDLDDSEQSTLQDELLAIEHRTYLWLKLIIEVILDEIGLTKKKLKGIINTLPATVEQAYEAILTKSKNPRRARKLLQIITTAARPLTLGEMNIALAIEDHHRSSEELDLENEARFATTIRRLCGLFVSVIDQKVYLIHQTAKEFLVAKDQVLCNSWKQSLSATESELLMARICITYLMFESFDSSFIDSTFDESSFDVDRERYDPSVKHSVEQHGYLEYAATFWCFHYKKVQNTAPNELLQAALILCETQSERFQIWFNAYWDTAHENDLVPWLNNIIVASYFGLEAVIEQLLRAEVDVESKDIIDRQTPLSWAAHHGHEIVIKQLLEAGADVKSKDTYGQTPLSWAAQNGYEAVVKQLLEAGSDVESKDSNHGRTPLSWAALNGHKAAAKYLLDAGANVESNDTSGQTPLLSAARNGHEIVVKQLIEAGADVNSKGTSHGRTPLSWAAELGHDTVIWQLLDAGADVESKDNIHGQTILSMATKKGRGNLVTRLIEFGADIESKDKNGQTPLSWACEMEHTAVVKHLLEAGAAIQSPLLFAARTGHAATIKLLIEAGADVESKDTNEQTSLSLAAHFGHEAILKHLLEAGANVKSKDIKGRTPLSNAVLGGHETIAKQLLEAGVDTETKDVGGETPLLLAVRCRQEAIVKQLLEAGADIKTNDISGQTPLLLAIRYKQEAIVKLLLEAGADTGTKDVGGGTPILLAIRYKQEAIVKQLLEAGADAETKDNSGGTPLLLAIRCQQEVIVKQLLEAGADTKTKDISGDSPLLIAVRCQQEAIVRQLLEAGADTEAEDVGGGTPLLLAVRSRHEAMVKQLLEAGADTERKDTSGQTPLLLAVRYEQEAVVKQLIKGGANIETKNSIQQTPLLLAVRGGHDAIFKRLLEAGANIEAKDIDGQTSLSIAALKGYRTVVTQLLIAGADVEVTDLRGQTPLSNAILGRFNSIIAQLSRVLRQRRLKEQ
jgi:ankyrin repeat protein